MKFEVQRLLQRDRTTVMVVDVAAILRAVAEVEPGTTAELWHPGGLMAEFFSVAAASVAVWFIGPTALPTRRVGQGELHAAHQGLVGLQPAGVVIRSAEPLGGVLAGLQALAWPVTLVTAGVERHPYELHTLTLVTDVIDIETGKRWCAADVPRKFGVTPLHLTLLCATTGSPPCWPCLAQPRADLSRYEDKIAKAISRGCQPEADLPPTVREKVQHARRRIDALVDEMRGRTSTPDLHARQRLGLALQAPPVSAVSLSSLLSSLPLTAYVVASIDFETGSPQFIAAEVHVAGMVDVAHGHAACRALLKDVHATVPSRWFAPRALDLLVALADQGDPIPERAVDPGLVNYVFHPGGELDLAAYCTSACLMSDEQKAWMSDVRREVPAPPLKGILAILPALDAELHALLVQEKLVSLVEHDVGATLPVLARVERRGGHVGKPGGFPSWAAFDAFVAARMTELEQLLLPALGTLDPYGALEPLVVQLFAQHPLKKDDLDICTKAPGRLDRLAARGLAAARALIELRSLDSTVAQWRPVLVEGADVRGRWCPQKTGRWGLRTPALTSLRKRGRVGGAIRGAFVPPPRYAFVVSDFNAFEGRLLAAASRDPLLLEACEAPDFHAYVAKAIFNRDDNKARAWSKGVLYSVGYGQTRKSFVRDQHDLTPREARRVHRTVLKHLTTLREYQRDRRAEYREHPDRPVQTPGGWERFAVTWRQAFNNGIQAHAADIFRWVLRTLDHELVKYDAYIVHWMHDEVFVSTPEAHVLDVAALVKRVMEDDVKRSGLLPSPVRLVADVTVRTSWRKD